MRRIGGQCKRSTLREMEDEEILPTFYGLIIAFLAALVGYVLWVSA